MVFYIFLSLTFCVIVDFYPFDELLKVNSRLCISHCYNYYKDYNQLDTLYFNINTVDIPFIRVLFSRIFIFLITTEPHHLNVHRRMIISSSFVYIRLHYQKQSTQWHILIYRRDLELDQKKRFTMIWMEYWNKATIYCITSMSQISSESFVFGYYDTVRTVRTIVRYILSSTYYCKNMVLFLVSISLLSPTHYYIYRTDRVLPGDYSIVLKSFYNFFRSLSRHL